MNKTFKVVFNKVRGAMTVVNEVTSCVQAKGTKTVLGIVVAAALSGTACAGTVLSGNAGAFIGNDAETTINNAENQISISFNEDGSVTVNSNKYESVGNYGAITNLNNKQETTLNIVGGEFNGNTAENAGGALTVFQDGKLGVKAPTHKISGVNFTENKASGKGGGAIAFLSDSAVSKEGETVITNSNFTGNKSSGTGSQQGGGAIYVEGTTVVVNGNTTFTENHSAVSGGAIYVHAVESDLKVDGASFIRNAADKNAGAIMLWSDGKVAEDQKFSIKNATFDSNEARNKGGAIAWLQMEKDAKQGQSLTVEVSSFESNTATSGGAIHAEDDLIVNSSTFTGNAAKNGGAIALSNLGDSINSTITNSKFEGNTAERKGGAIVVFNMEDDYKHSNTLTLENVTFKDNSVTGASDDGKVGGGAILVEGGDSSISLVLKGNIVFQNNTVNGKLNDIHNNGAITVQGSLSLDGGITGSGDLVFAGGSALNVKVGASQAESTTITNNVTVGKDVALSMTFAPGYVGSYQLVQDGQLNGSFELVENDIFNITADAEKHGSYNISLKDTTEIAQGVGADSNQAAAISALMRAAGDNETFTTIATAIGTDLQSADPVRKHAALDAVTAMSPDVAPVFVQVQTDTAAQVFGVIGSRLGGSQGMSSGDGTSGTALWVQGMVGMTDMDDTSKAHGYDADSNGLALGLEAKPTNSTTVGMGFAYTNTDVDGFLRSTDVDSYTAFLYGEYKPANWYVNGILSYAWANYEEQANVAGYGVGSKYDADTLGLQLMGGLDLAVSGFTLTPEAGLRYYHIGRDSYTNSMGSSVADSDEDVLTGVIGARFAKAFEVSPAMSVVPQVRLAMTYDIVDADNTSFVTLANGSSYSVDGETLDRFGVEADIGVKAEMGDNFEMSLSYEGAWRGDYQNHAGILNAKYKF